MCRHRPCPLTVVNVSVHKRQVMVVNLAVAAGFDVCTKRRNGAGLPERAPVARAVWVRAGQRAAASPKDDGAMDGKTVSRAPKPHRFCRISPITAR